MIFNMNDDKIINMIKEISVHLKNEYRDFLGIYYYGSRVQGNYKPDSDYDLLFIFDRKVEWQFKEEIRHLIYEYEGRFNIIIDSKIISRNEIDMNRMPLIQEVKKYGIYYGV